MTYFANTFPLSNAIDQRLEKLYVENAMQVGISTCFESSVKDMGSLDEGTGVSVDISTDISAPGVQKQG